MKREHRYMVFKLTDMEASLTRQEINLLERLAEKVRDYRTHAGKQPLECVVVESDWPEYEPTWQAIENRMDGTESQEQVEPTLNEALARACELEDIYIDTDAPPWDWRKFSKRNLRRCTSVDGFNHALGSWSLSDWMTATLGELGEAANVLKKLNRERDGVPGNDKTVDELRQDFAHELADTFIYLDLLAQAAGIDLPNAVLEKFSITSAKRGYMEPATFLNSLSPPANDIRTLKDALAQPSEQPAREFARDATQPGQEAVAWPDDKCGVRDLARTIARTLSVQCDVGEDWLYSSILPLLPPATDEAVRLDADRLIAALTLEHQAKVAPKDWFVLGAAQLYLRDKYGTLWHCNDQLREKPSFLANQQEEKDNG